MRKKRSDMLVKRLVLAVGLFSLIACSHVPYCGRQSGKPLQRGKTVSVTIYADKVWNDTAIQVEPGAEYIFGVSNQAIWYDASIASRANGYSKAMLALFVPLRRKTSLPWFALICTVDFRDDFRVFEDSPCFGDAPKQACADKAESPAETCTQIHSGFAQSGTLYCYANDVSAMYGNNSGSIELTVTKR